MKRALMLLLTLAASPCMAQDLSQGLTAYLPLDGSTTDTGPSHYTVTSSGGVTFVPGRIGQAAQFDGLDDYLLMLHPGLTVDFDDEAFSVAFWVWIDPAQDEFYFMQERYGANTSAVSSGGCMSCDTLQWGGVWYDGAHHGAYAQTIGIQSLASAWHHLAFCYERTSSTTGNLLLYVDGVLRSTTPRLSAPFDPPPPGLVIGAGENGNMGNYFKGRIDELRLYERSLTAQEVLLLATGLSISQGPIDYRTSNGRPAMFAVRALGEGLQYQWRRNGVPLNDSANFQGTHTAVLSIPYASSVLAGTYDVVVTSGMTQQASNPATLTVGCSLADIGGAGGQPHPDSALDNNDFIAFINQFFAGCD